MISLLFIVLKSMYGFKSKYPSIVFLSILSNLHKIKGVHGQCVNNHDTKLEYKGMNTVGVIQITKTRHPLSILDGKNV